MMKRLFWLLGAWLLLATSNVEAKTDTVSLTAWVSSRENLYWSLRGPDSTDIEAYALDPSSNDTIFSRKERLAPGKRYSHDIDRECILKMRFYSSNAPRIIGLGLSDNDTTCAISIKGNLRELDVSGCTSLKILFRNRYNNDTKVDTLKIHGVSMDTLVIGGHSDIGVLDASGCTSLTSLDCRDNDLTSLDVSGCTALTSLDCSDNDLTSLEVSGCTALTSLDCSHNRLTSLDVSGCTALTSLDCAYNRLTNLEVSGCTALTSLECIGNQLTSLNLKNCAKLKRLICGGRNLSTRKFMGNLLTSLDVSGCSALEELQCLHNQLTSLDVSGCTALTSLDCAYNRLTNLDVSGYTALTSLDCSDNDLTSLDVSGCTALSKLKLRDNHTTLKKLEVSGCTALKDLDLTYNGRLIDLSTLDLIGCISLKHLDLSYVTVDTLKIHGISMDSLTMEVYDTKINLLDASGCTSLTYLNCGDYYRIELGAVNVSGCTALMSLNCRYNNLTSLDVSGCTALTSLICSQNNLTSLDVSTNTALTSLNCDGNDLTELDISTNAALTSLHCSGNPLCMPLSQIYEIYTRTTWEEFNMGNQSDSIILLVNQSLDLSTERIIGQTTTDFKLTDAYGREVSSDFWTENRFVFQFHEPLKYTLTLQNPNVKSIYNNKEYPVKFTWHISVLNEMPDNYFTINVTSNHSEWGTAKVTGNGIYEEGKTATITAKPQEGYRFVNWTKKDGAIFSTEAVYSFTVTENLELIANFEKQPDGVANENRQDDNFRVYVQDHTIHLSEERGLVQVYNMTGQCVYSGVSTAIPVGQGGLYIVNVGGYRYKVFVK